METVGLLIASIAIGVIVGFSLRRNFKKHREFYEENYEGK
jgi:hypothetical protein